LKKSILKVDSNLKPKSIKLIDSSKLFDSKSNFDILEKTDSNHTIAKPSIGIVVKDIKSNNKSSNSLVAYNSSESD
jgi:hypothetical protein